MLSILIPIYNFDVVSFVLELKKQCEELKIDFEILCIDDASSLYKKANQELKNEEHIFYDELSENIGRSRIRNLLAEKATYDSLLFLDCDSSVNDHLFIKRYVNALKKAPVIYGGRNYREDSPEDETYFRWWYGVNRETIQKEKRIKHPYQSFMTNNFLIDKKIYLDVRLDEDIEGYGHEDTLFGLELKKRDIKVLHINNPLRHIGLEGFKEFISKTKQGLSNLHKLLKAGKIDDSVRVVKAYKKIKGTFIENILYKYFQKNEQQILERLNKKTPNLKWFDFYKLGYLISLNR